MSQMFHGFFSQVIPPLSLLRNPDNDLAQEDDEEDRVHEIQERDEVGVGLDVVHHREVDEDEDGVCA